jgi:hypothetical protein
LNKYNNQMKTLFEIDIISKVYDLWIQLHCI